jgi:DNA-binding TFAR19-related protein (PDSD5 family)
LTRTTLELDSEVRKRLKTFKLVKKESYDELLVRLMDHAEKTGFQHKVA